jgi:hypothetical protein
MFSWVPGTETRRCRSELSSLSSSSFSLSADLVAASAATATALVTVASDHRPHPDRRCRSCAAWARREGAKGGPHREREHESAEPGRASGRSHLWFFPQLAGEPETTISPRCGCVTHSIMRDAVARHPRGEARIEPCRRLRERSRTTPEARRRNAGHAPAQDIIAARAARLSLSCRSSWRRSGIRAAGTCPASWCFPAAPGLRWHLSFSLRA